MRPNHRSHRAPAPGFSLLELLTTLLVISIVLSMAGPALNQLTLDSRRTADINALITSIQLARSESAKRSLPVVVCGTADGLGCGGSPLDRGWLVFVNRTLEHPPDVDPADIVLLSHEPDMGGTIRSNRPFYIFRPGFRRSTNGTITFCDRRGPVAARAVIVSYTGRPRVSATGPGGRALECAA